MWTIGREREKEHAAKFVKEDAERRLLFPVIDAAHDLVDGRAATDSFIAACRVALTSGKSGVWENTANWVRKVGLEQPQALTLWDELATHPKWQVRWRVACCLYLDIPEEQSDRLFSSLRSDASQKVREYAISRYEYRPDGSGVVEKRFDAADFGA